MVSRAPQRTIRGPRAYLAAVPSDEELLDALRAGDLAAFDALYARYERRLFGYIRRSIPDRDRAEDLFQDVLFTVIADRTFDPSRGRFAAWLFTVARNRCAEQARRAEQRGAREHLVRAPTESPEDPESAVDRNRQVRAAMAELPEPQRQLLMLKQVGELTYREIAAALGVAEGTIKSRLHDATRALRARLVELGESQ